MIIPMMLKKIAGTQTQWIFLFVGFWWLCPYSSYQSCKFLMIVGFLGTLFGDSETTTRWRAPFTERITPNMELLRKIAKIVLKNNELFIWVSAIFVLYSLPESSGGSLCLLKALGQDWCPGCGLGHSIQAALHGDWKHSFAVHSMGIFTLFVLFWRIVQLSYILFKQFKKKNHAT